MLPGISGCGASVGVALIDILATYGGDTVTDPANASVVLTFATTGALTVTNSSGTVTSTWGVSGTTGADYALFVTLTSGTFTTGATGTLLPLSTARSYSVTQNVPGFKSCTATFEIRPAAGGAALDTQSITLEAEVVSGA